MVRRALGIGVIAVSLAACSHAQVGHQGERLDDAVKAWAVPVHRNTHLTFQGQPVAWVSSSVKNLTDRLLFVSCSADASDGGGHHLFNVDVGPYGFLDPGQSYGGRNSSTGSEVVDATRAQVRAVERYDVTCDVHPWVGLTPGEVSGD